MPAIEKVESDKQETLIIIPPYPGKGLSYSLGAGYVISSLRAAGIGTELLDEPCLDFDSGARRLISRIKQLSPDVVGFSLNTSLNILYAYDFLKLVRSALPEAKLVAGGLHATLLPGEVLDAGFDAAVIGDGEETFKELILRWREGKSPAGMSGIAWRSEDGSRYIGRASYVEDIDDLPPPSNRFYSETGDADDRLLILLLSRGCFRKCTFCVERHLNRGVRYRSEESVFSEIEDAVTNHSIANLHFIDSSFLENIELVRSLCDRMTKLAGKRPFHWKCMARTDHLDEETLALMKSAGCTDIFIGMESANDDTLKMLRKRICSEQNEQAIRLCSDAGINVSGYFITGLPWEGPRHFQNNLDFMDKFREKASFIVFVPIPFPGTQLYNDYHREYGFTEWWLEDYLEAVEKPGRPLFRWLQSRNPFLERNFFNYSAKTRNYLCRFPLSTRHAIQGDGWKMGLRKLAWAVASLCSRILFFVSPALEHRIMKPLYKGFNSIAARLKTAR